MRSFGRFLAIFLLWTATWWLVLGSLLRPVLPGGWLTVLGAAIVCTAPLLGMIRSRTGGGYPSALKRLGVVHPFWYVQLFLPLLAISGLIGALAGLPFGESGLAGRWALAVAAASLAVL